MSAVTNAAQPGTRSRRLSRRRLWCSNGWDYLRRISWLCPGTGRWCRRSPGTSR
jgi:hypothetical protein